MNSAKKPFRCKFIFGERYVRRVPKTVNVAVKVEIPDISKMPQGMTTQVLDRIIMARAIQARPKRKPTAK